MIILLVNTLSAEYAALKEECASLRHRIQDVEQEMKK